MSGVLKKKIGESWVPVSIGAQGPTGDKGDKGDTGDPGVHKGNTPPEDTSKLWLDTTELAIPITSRIRDLFDVSADTPNEGDTITYSDGMWTASSFTPSFNLISDISDIDVSEVENGSVLVYQDGVWVAGALASELTELTDVHVESAQDGDILAFHNGSWISSPPPAEKLLMTRSNKDAYGLFTVIELRRLDGTLARRSELSGGESPEYETRTDTEYEADGATIKNQVVIQLSYDEDAALINEEVQQ